MRAAADDVAVAVDGVGTRPTSRDEGRKIYSALSRLPHGCQARGAESRAGRPRRRGSGHRRSSRRPHPARCTAKHLEPTRRRPEDRVRSGAGQVIARHIPLVVDALRAPARGGSRKGRLVIRPCSVLQRPLHGEQPAIVAIALSSDDASGLLNGVRLGIDVSSPDRVTAAWSGWRTRAPPPAFGPGPVRPWVSAVDCYSHPTTARPKPKG